MGAKFQLKFKFRKTTNKNIIKKECGILWSAQFDLYLLRRDEDVIVCSFFSQEKYSFVQWIIVIPVLVEGIIFYQKPFWTWRCKRCYIILQTLASTSTKNALILKYFYCQENHMRTTAYRDLKICGIIGAMFT